MLSPTLGGLDGRESAAPARPDGLVVGHVVVGPQQHGVVLFALNLAQELSGPLLRHPAGAGVPKEELCDLASQSGIVHLQFTDALYAERCDLAADRFLALRRSIPGPVSVTLHDLPDPHDAHDRYARRREAYRRVHAAVDAVVVSSRHEADLLDQAVGRPVRPAVIPLPIESRRHSAGGVRAGEIGLLGFIHPGKGYEQAISELDGFPGRLTLTALGRPAAGHDDLPRRLEARSRRAGHRWRVTGYLPEPELAGRLREVAVPLAPNPRFSASGSLNSWLAAGRRPLVAEGPYAREVAARLPGAIRLYRPGELVEAVREALADPASTWLQRGISLKPDGAGVARAYRRVLEAAC